MTVVLARRLNMRLIHLSEENAGTQDVGVLRRNGRYRYVRWLGFVGKGEASKLGRPVKLEIRRIGDASLPGVNWVDVPAGQHVQGCLTRRGVYAVVESSVRIV